MNEVKLTVESSQGELTIRKGEAPSILQPSSVSISGTISAPADWYKSKADNGVEFDLKEMYVIHDIENHVLKLVINEKFPSIAVNVSGSIEDNSELSKFGINTSRKYTAKDLAQFLKMNRIHFVDREQCMKIVSSLNNLKLSIQREIENNNDFKGNKSNLFEQKVKSDIDLEFTLNTPILKGSAPSVFKVEVLFDVTDSGATYWLESVELKEQKDQLCINLIDNELKRLDPITVIKK